MIKSVLSEAKQHMDKAIEAMQHEMSTVRTGRANIALLDGIRVDYYGSLTPINQVANIAAPEPRMITIQPWEKRMVAVIEKAILAANLGITPSNDGTIIRLPIPSLTEERRRDLVRVVHKMAEEVRVSVRNGRREANDQLKKLEKKGDISKDDSRRTQEEIQEITGEYIEQIDELLARKEAEIMEV
jgi:ribosome recycling factor